jgi:peptide/nickel transport system permease protein
MAVAHTELPAEFPAVLAAPSRRGFWPRFLRHRLAQVGLLLLFGLLFVALFAPVLAPFDPAAAPTTASGQTVGLSQLGEPARPGATALAGKTFRLGADPEGRDVLSRVLFGARISLVVGVFAMITALLIGTTVGLLGGYFGGWVDVVLTRFTEIIMALPTILLAIVLAAVLPDNPAQLPPFLASLWEGVIARVLPADLAQLGLFKLLLAVSLVTWTGIARAVRGQVLSLKERPYVEAARALGVSHVRILWRHLLPNTLPTLITLATLAVAHNILLEAGLSYLGVGLPPSSASWGGTIAGGQTYFLSAPWIVLAPGVAIVLAVAAFNLLGQALQETLEPAR